MQTLTEYLKLAGVVFGVGLAYGIYSNIMSLIEAFQRNKSDKATREKTEQINKAEGALDEINKASSTSLDEYKRIKREYDSDKT